MHRQSDANRMRMQAFGVKVSRGSRRRYGRCHLRCTKRTAYVVVVGVRVVWVQGTKYAVLA
eukprot:m.441432 g.441432  ORF g.441432 m.441432 type:complete len:61 (-) comp21469_c1_seq11:287-469(-)